MDIKDDIIRIAKSLKADYPYDNLNDAVSSTGNTGYSIGNTEIWYAKDMLVNKGLDWMVAHGTAPDRKDLRKTHVFLGRISKSNPNEVYKMMQGQFWSPDGEANMMLRRKGVGHTSMSTGDIIVVGDKAMMVDSNGWKNITDVSPKETISKIKEFVRKTFRMTPDEEDSYSINFSTRDNGDVGEEQASPIDVQHMKKVRDALKKEFGENGIKYRIEIIDEWVHLTVSIG